MVRFGPFIAIVVIVCFAVGLAIGSAYWLSQQSRRYVQARNNPEPEGFPTITITEPAPDAPAEPAAPPGPEPETLELTKKEERNFFIGWLSGQKYWGPAFKERNKLRKARVLRERFNIV